MPRHLTVALLAALALAGAAHAEPLPDPPPGGTWDGTYHAYTYDTVSVDGRWKMRCHVPVVGTRRCVVTAPTKRTVHLYGDSILKGWGWGHYDDPSFLGRPDLIATALSRGSALTFNRTTVQAPSEICKAVKSGAIKRTDSIVFENAGPHFGTARAYQRWLEAVVWCSRPAARLMLTTMFDYQPDLLFSRYDDPLEDGRSANTVTRQVARASRSHLADWNGRMDALTRALPELRLVHPDGIHPTVLGNVVLAGSLVRNEGVMPRIGVVVDEVMLQRDRIVALGWAPAFDRAQAEAWVRRLVG